MASLSISARLRFDNDLINRTENRITNEVNSVYRYFERSFEMSEISGEGGAKEKPGKMAPGFFISPYRS